MNGGHATGTAILTLLKIGHLWHEQRIEGHLGSALVLGLGVVGALHVCDVAGAGREQVAHGQHIRRPRERQQLALGLLQRRGDLCKFIPNVTSIAATKNMLSEPPAWLALWRTEVVLASGVRAKTGFFVKQGGFTHLTTLTKICPVYLA